MLLECVTVLKNKFGRRVPTNKCFYLKLHNKIGIFNCSFDLPAYGKRRNVNPIVFIVTNYSVNLFSYFVNNNIFILEIQKCEIRNQMEISDRKDYNV